MFKLDYPRSRQMTSKLLKMAEDGLIDWESLAREALGWMSEAEVAQFARANEYVTEEEDEE